MELATETIATVQSAMPLYLWHAEKPEKHTTLAASRRLKKRTNKRVYIVNKMDEKDACGFTAPCWASFHPFGQIPLR